MQTNLVDQSRIDKGMYWQKALSLVSGCTPISTACNACWAATEASMRSRQSNPKIRARYAGLTTDGRFNGTVRCNDDLLDLPLRTRKPTCWAVWTDLMHSGVPSEFIASALAVAIEAYHHKFLICTKRPERMASLLTSSKFHESLANAYATRVDPHCERGDADFDLIMGAAEIGEPLTSNIALGTTVENQAAVSRIGHLMRCPAAMRYLSVEPLLEDIRLNLATSCDRKCNEYDYAECPGTSGKCIMQPCVDWVLIGAQTGPHRRPCKLEWVRSVIDQAKAAGVPVFVKALEIDGRIAKDMQQFPEWARLREFPEVMSDANHS